MKTARLFILPNWESHGQALAIGANRVGFFFNSDISRPFRKFKERFFHLKSRLHENS